MRAFVTVLVLAALVAFALPASAEFDVYELVPGPPGRPYDPTWPPDGTTWHQMVPAAAFCTQATQTDHDDVDGDGQISFCDNIKLGGDWKHIEWVGPTIKIEPVGGGDMLYVEPVDGGRQNEYHIIHPPELACTIATITGDMAVECQIVTVEPPSPFEGEWHIVEVGTNIHTNGGSPVEQGTWTKIKSFFSNLF